MALDDHLGPALSNEVLSAIGYVTTYWGQLEDHASSATAFLLDCVPYGFRGVSTNMMGSSKFDSLCAVAEMKLPPEQFESLKLITERAAALTAERNRIIHGCWYPTKNPKVAKRYSYRAYGSLKQKEERVSAARLRSFGDEIAGELKHRIGWLDRAGFYERYEGPPVPSPKKRPVASGRGHRNPDRHNGRQS